MQNNEPPKQCGMTSPPTLLIIGASTRAAAFSAIASGYKVQCADLFADRDLAAVCNVKKIADYPQGFSQCFESTDADTWIFTGALENYPKLLAQWSDRLPLLGSNAKAIENVRNPDFLFRSLHNAGIPAPSVYRSVIDVPHGRPIVQKPIRSAGGLNISKVENPTNAIRGFYFQDYIDGCPMAAIFVGTRNSAELIGVTKQLIGTDWCNSKKFQYCGSMGPIDLSQRDENAWRQIGDHLVKEFQLRGIFGVDAIVNDEIHPIEVNPRYTASVEVLDRTYGMELISRHIDACCETGEEPAIDPPKSKQQGFEPDTVCGKAILYANRDINISPTQSNALLSEAMHGELPRFADIPECGVIRRGSPIMTVFAEAHDLARLEDSLRTEVGSIEAMLQSRRG